MLHVSSYHRSYNEETIACSCLNVATALAAKDAPPRLLSRRWGTRRVLVTSEARYKPSHSRPADCVRPTAQSVRGHVTASDHGLSGKINNRRAASRDRSKTFVSHAAQNNFNEYKWRGSVRRRNVRATRPRSSDVYFCLVTE